MVDRRPRLTLWGDGEYMLSSGGADGSATMVVVLPDGRVRGSGTTPAGLRELVALEPEVSWVTWFVPDVDTKLRTLRAELGAWGPAAAATVRYRDGVEAVVKRGRDHDWGHWETVTSPSHETPKGWASGDNRWTTIWHPWERAAGGGSTRESFTYGSEEFRGHRSSYSTSAVVERDASGQEVRRTSVTGGYDHTTGTQERGVTIRYGNGDWVKQVHRTEQDGSWTDTTTTKQGGHYVTRTSSGHGSTTDTYSETESDEDPTDDGEDPEPEPTDDGSESPTGDGTDAGSEGNPEGPLAGVDIRDLIGDDWKGGEDLDTLGDLDGLMRPWLERIRATLAAGGSGRPDTGELLDTLGAPPVLDVYLVGYEPDDLAEHDSLGKPPPIFGTRVTVAGAEAVRESALSVTELLAAAEPFARSASVVAQSAPLLRSDG